MKFDVYASYSVEVQTDDNTRTEKSTSNRFRNLMLDEVKSKVEEVFKSIPENANNFYMEIHKSYEEQMDVALKSM